MKKKKFSRENKLDKEKNYIIVFNDFYLDKILFFYDMKFILLSKNTLYVQKEDRLDFKFLNDITSVISIHFYEIKDNLDNQQLIYQHDCINKTISNNIFLLEDFLEDKLCDELVSFFDNNQQLYKTECWSENSNVNCKYFYLENNSFSKIDYFNEQLFKVIDNIITYLYKEHKINSSADSGYCLRKIYGPTRLHIDGVENHSKLRNVAVIMCLNSDYDGGEFFFPYQDFKVKLKKGQILAFPPYWTHKHMVNAPLNGTYRYTVNTWLLE